MKLAWRQWRSTLALGTWLAAGHAPGIARELVARELVAQELVAQELVVRGLVAQDLPDSLADRPLATRAALEALAHRLEQAPGPGDSARLDRVRARLEQGDFRPGDRVLLEVQGESALTDTFTVGGDLTLQLPSPTVGALSLRGVLRAEVEEHLARYVRRFVQRPVVRARPLLHLSFEGEVARAGFHAVAADAPLADALMAAGGATTNANLRKLRIQRAGRTLWEGEALHRAIASRVTVDEAYLKDGDQVIVARHRQGAFQDNLRFLWILVSITGGIYGLSRAF